LIFELAGLTHNYNTKNENSKYYVICTIKTYALISGNNKENNKFLIE